MNFQQKMQLYFIDFYMMPQLVFENYLSCFQNAIGQQNYSQQANMEQLENIANCGDLFSIADNLIQEIWLN